MQYLFIYFKVSDTYRLVVHGTTCYKHWDWSALCWTKHVMRPDYYRHFFLHYVLFKNNENKSWLEEGGYLLQHVELIISSPTTLILNELFPSPVAYLTTYTLIAIYLCWSEVSWEHLANQHMLVRLWTLCDCGSSIWLLTVPFFCPVQSRLMEGFILPLPSPPLWLSDVCFFVYVCAPSRCGYKAAWCSRPEVCADQTLLDSPTHTQIDDRVLFSCRVGPLYSSQGLTDLEFQNMRI